VGNDFSSGCTRTTTGEPSGVGDPVLGITILLGGGLFDVGHEDIIVPVMVKGILRLLFTCHLKRVVLLPMKPTTLEPQQQHLRTR